MASTLAKINTIKSSQVNKKDSPTFSWTDKEVQLLLERIKIFKVNMEAEGVGWESLRGTLHVNFQPGVKFIPE